MLDEQQMVQVFVNLITNAEQAMTPAHGKGLLHVTSSVAGDSIRIRVADDGPGIASEHLGRLFDPFFTTKEVGKGTGLDLSIC
jgi:two-component system NtrC family sensor kinase